MNKRIRRSAGGWWVGLLLVGAVGMELWLVGNFTALLIGGGR